MEQTLAPPIDWARRARLLAIATIAWNLVEGLVAMGFGWAEDSVALFGFGVDSWVEVGSAAIVLRKLLETPGCKATQRAREQVAARRISKLFLVLALGTALGALVQLRSGGHPHSTLPSTIVSVVSLSGMGFLWQAKRSAAAALGSRVLAMDAACSLACIQLSVVLLAGSLLYVLVPALWWADAVAALLLAGLIGREGLAGLGSEDAEGGCGCGG